MQRTPVLKFFQKQLALLHFYFFNVFFPFSLRESMSLKEGVKLQQFEMNCGWNLQL